MCVAVNKMGKEGSNPIEKRGAASAPRSLSPGYIAWRLHRHLRRRAASAANRRMPHSSLFGLDELCRHLDRSQIAGFPEASAIVAHFRTRTSPAFYFHEAQVETIVALLNGSEPGTVEQTTGRADRICRGYVDLLGMGSVEVGTPPDWNRQFPDDGVWPADYYVRLESIAPGLGSDLRLTWELSRCHHFVTLAQAYRYRGDAKYAEEFARQFTDWVDKNPAPWGVNWMMPMEAAIRAVNWIWAFYLLRTSDAVPDDTWLLFLDQVRRHAEFIHSNLEYGRVTGNHYLADGMALVHLGLLFPELLRSRRWLKTGTKILWTELPRQVHSDGGYYESSIGYHRLVLEMASLSAALCRRNGIPVPPEIRDTLGRMHDFMLAYMKSDGTGPDFGDNDDGRVLRLASTPCADHRSVSAVAAACLERDHFPSTMVSRSEYIWLAGRAPTEHPVVAATSSAATESGIYVIRRDSLYMAIDAGGAGRCGLGTHAHNDTLSFVLSAYGCDFIIDSGTWLYTASRERRIHYRSTRAHNVVMVDHREMAPLDEGFFGVSDAAHPTVAEWKSTDEYDVFIANHRGYSTLPDPVVVTRRILFGRRENLWVVEDVVRGSAPHSAELRLHLAPVKADRKGSSVVAGNEGSARLLIMAVETLPAPPQLVSEPVSLCYGSEIESTTVVFAKEGPPPLTFVTVFAPVPPGVDFDLPAIEKAASGMKRQIELLSN
jgi:hypothetical protein